MKEIVKNSKGEEVTKRKIKSAVTCKSKFKISELSRKKLMILLLTFAMISGPRTYANAPDINKHDKNPLRVEQFLEAGVITFGSETEVPKEQLNEGLNDISPECIKIVRKSIQHLEGSEYTSFNKNKDGQGISYGIYQWTTASGNLQLLLESIDTKNTGLLEEVFKEKYQIIKELYIAHEGENKEQAKARQLKLSQRICNDKEIEKGFIELGQRAECQNEQDLAAELDIIEAAENCRDLNIESLEGLVLIENLKVHFGSGFLKKLSYLKDTDISEKEKLKTIGQKAVKSANGEYKNLVQRRISAILENENVIINGESVNLKEMYGITDRSFYKSADVKMKETNSFENMELTKLSLRFLNNLQIKSEKSTDKRQLDIENQPEIDF